MKFQTLVVSGWVVVSAATAAAQAVPNLSGTWALDREKTAAVAPAGGAMGGRSAIGSASATATASPRGGATAMTGGGAGGAAEWTITQTAAALTITRGLPDGSTQRLVYKLDGSESVGAYGRVTQKTRTTVAGGKFTTTGTQTVNTDQGDLTSQFKEVRWLDKDGSMVVEMTRLVEGSGSRTITTVLTKKK
jgi:hypothetical protein